MSGGRTAAGHPAASVCAATVDHGTAPARLSPENFSAAEPGAALTRLACPLVREMVQPVRVEKRVPRFAAVAAALAWPVWRVKALFYRSPDAPALTEAEFASLRIAYFVALRRRLAECEADAARLRAKLREFEEEQCQERGGRHGDSSASCLPSWLMLLPQRRPCGRGSAPAFSPWPSE